MAASHLRVRKRIEKHGEAQSKRFPCCFGCTSCGDLVTTGTTYGSLRIQAMAGQDQSQAYSHISGAHQISPTGVVAPFRAGPGTSLSPLTLVFPKYFCLLSSHQFTDFDKVSL